MPLDFFVLSEIQKNRDDLCVKINNLIFQDKIVTLNKKEISENYLGYFQQAEKLEYFLVIFNNRKFPEDFLDIISNRKLQPDFPGFFFFFNQLSIPERFHTKANLKDLIGLKKLS